VQFKFTGETAEVFPFLPLGRVVEPGDVVELDKDPKHPRLERVKDVPKAKSDSKESD